MGRLTNASNLAIIITHMHPTNQYHRRLHCDAKITMGYWEERQAAAQAKLTAKNIKETEEQLKRYYKRTMENVIGQFEETYNKVLLRIEDGKNPTPADLYKLDTYWKMQAQLRDELTKLGDKQAKLYSQKFMEEW